RRPPVGVGEHRLGVAHGQTADQVQHEAHLVGRLADVLRLSFNFHQRLIPFSRLATWPRKVRVGANSPSLCPTIDSVMYTGTCLRPSWTAIVWPTMSGMIVERRDQVLMTFFSPFSLRSSTLVNRCPSTNGPFFSERGMTTSASRGCGVAGR